MYTVSIGEPCWWRAVDKYNFVVSVNKTWGFWGGVFFSAKNKFCLLCLFLIYLFKNIFVEVSTSFLGLDVKFLPFLLFSLKLNGTNSCMPNISGDFSEPSYHLPKWTDSGHYPHTQLILMAWWKLPSPSFTC